MRIKRRDHLKKHFFGPTKEREVVDMNAAFTKLSLGFNLAFSFSSNQYFTKKRPGKGRNVF